MMNGIAELKEKLMALSKEELVEELIGALVEVAEPLGPKPVAHPIGCMRAKCPHPEKCTDAWKCLNPGHEIGADHGPMDWTFDGRSDRGRSDGGPGQN